jgi:hypothetical protein
MSLDRRRDKDRVPTSAELEQRGEASIPAASEVGRAPGILKRLLRAGRLRVSEDLAARKHVGGQPRIDVQGIQSRSAADAAVPTEIESATPSSTASFTPASPQAEPPRRSGRRIRIESPVRDRRGHGKRPDST